MNKKAIQTLEYNKIIEQLVERASSPLGKEKCRNLKPSVQLSEIETMQLQTSHALTRLFQKGSISFGNTKDIRASLKRLEIGSSLGIVELLTICSFLENVTRVKA
ncbi:MAG: endonuclease MutS2, partial [Lachnospiraceae bacterium]|nr:endonuclease MutS2 [Lachnospiraceae bacterium]